MERDVGAAIRNIVAWLGRPHLSGGWRFVLGQPAVCLPGEGISIVPGVPP